MVQVLEPIEHHLEGDGEIAEFVVDSRKVKQGDVFVAIPGQRTDGHRFVDQAFAQGAASCLVSSLDGIQRRQDCIVVDDTVQALGFLAASHRNALNTRVVGLTGSVGKTTTKEILHTLLSMTNRTRKSMGNLNSTIGLPMELLKLQPEDEWMVAEMGMSFPGEIRDLVNIAKPDVGLFLAVRAVHMANFEDLEGIARAKAELVDFMAPDRTLVYNLDDPLVRKYSKKYKGEQFTYGMISPEADIQARILPFSDWSGTHFEIRETDGTRTALFLPMVGRYNVYNAIAACATAVAVEFPVSELSYGLKEVVPGEGRSVLRTFGNDIKLVDDTYNSNPHAVENVLRCFSNLAPDNYRWIILGDMLELGDREAEIHRELGDSIGGYGFDRITLVGDLTQNTYATLKDLKLDDCLVEHYPDAESAVNKMMMDVPAHARIWCKASRGIHLEHVTRTLGEYFGSQ